jgi:outer membrane protein OmpA-like peptidoglycan-associated protein
VQAADPADPMPIKIDRIAWQGENRVSFSDRSVQPPFEGALDVKQLQLSGIDSSRPDQPSLFTIQGSTGRYAKIKAEGKITLFQGNPDGNIKAVLKGIEMLPLSSYTIPAIGYNLDSGELDAQIDLALAKGDIEGTNHLIIRRLEVSEASEAQAEKLKAQISMPLDTALGMLQDKHQTIDLNLPVSGKLSDPNVALGDVINTALGNALKKGAMTYLTTALFPYGTMVALLKMAGDKAGAVQLDPVAFPAAADTLDDKDKDYLGKLAGVLKERPKIAIKLCGLATQADRAALAQALAQKAAQEQKAKELEQGEKPKQGDEPKAEQATQPPAVPDETLLALAKRRAEVIEDYLVKQHGVSPGRAAVCRPEIDAEAEAQPRVDLQI